MQREIPVLLALLGGQALLADNLVYKDADGLIQITPHPVGAEFQNLPWTASQEAAFSLRKNSVLNYSAANYGTGYGAGTWFEDEKRGYPRAMTTYLWAIANNDQAKINAARNHLEGFDAGPNTNYTGKVDYYAGFALKGQVPKYFYFGKYGRAASSTPNNYLNPISPTNVGGGPTANAMDRMLSGAKIWLNAGDPMVAAHPEVPNPTHASGQFTPEATGVRADPRGTDNLKAMREVAVYLFAREAAANETNPALAATFAGVRDLYATRYGEAARAIYRTGISEWDSPNYSSWSFGTHLGMFDFPPETEEQGRRLKRQAKATLDATLAGDGLIYWRGGFGGPGLRDYGGTNVAMGNDSARMMNFYFGDALVPDTTPILQNTLHALLSSYRPPQAIVGLVARDFARPVEVLSTKPTYANWTLPEIAKPRFFETLYFGNHYQMASLASPESPSDYAVGAWNASTFKIASFNSTRGVDFFAANTQSLDPSGNKNLGDQIAQYRNLALWLRPADGRSFYFMAPDPATAPGGWGTIEQDSGIWFFKMERNWVAMRPINLTWSSQANGTNAHLREKQQVFTSPNTAGSYAGFGIEVGELGQFADYAAFKTAVKARTLDLTQISSGIARLDGTDGSFVKLAFNPANDLPTVYRNSTMPHDFSTEENHALYQSLGTLPAASITGATVSGANVQITANAADASDRGPISLGWKTGFLSILSGTRAAPGYLFEQDFPMDGAVTWNERAATGTDYDGKVKRVGFHANGILIGEDANPSDGWSFNWAGATNGTHALTARAVDNDGQVVWSAPFEVVVSGGVANLAPACAISSPAAGDIFVAPASVQIQVNATDSDGTISKVEFFNGADLLGTDSTAPYVHTWTGVAAGTYVVTAVATDNVGTSTTSSPANVTVGAAAASGSYGGVAAAIPGRIQAENYDNGGQGVAYNDSDPGNTGGIYRTAEGVDVEIAGDAGGGYNVGWTAADEWMVYTVNVQTTGIYQVVLRSASGAGGGTLRIEFDGVDKTGSIVTPATGGWQTYTNVTVNNVSLTAGLHQMRVFDTSGGQNLNYYDFILESTPYDTWGNGPFTNPFTDRSPTVDFDGDGLVNLLEFVLGGDPTLSDNPSVMPSVQTAAGDDLVITFRRSDESQLAPLPATVKVQVSDDMGTWDPADEITIGSGPTGTGPNEATYTVEENGTGPDLVTVTIPKAMATRKFARVLTTR